MPKCDFNKVILQLGCSPVNLLYIFRTPFPGNTSGWLLLNVGPYAELVSGKLHLAENTVFLKSSPLPRQKIRGRSSRREMSLKKGLLKISLNLQENTRDSLFLINFQAVGLQFY